MNLAFEAGENTTEELFLRYSSHGNTRRGPTNQSGRWLPQAAERSLRLFSPCSQANGLTSPRSSHHQSLQGNCELTGQLQATTPQLSAGTFQQQHCSSEILAINPNSSLEELEIDIVENILESLASRSRDLGTDITTDQVSSRSSPIYQSGIIVGEDQSQTSIGYSLANQHVTQSFREALEFSPTAVSTQHAPINSSSHSREAFNFDFQDHLSSALSQKDYRHVPNTGEFTVPSSHTNGFQQLQSLAVFPNSSTVQHSTTPDSQQTFQNSPLPTAVIPQSSFNDFTGNSHDQPTPRVFYQTGKWLTEHFEPEEGSSILRFLLYSHYRKHYQSIGLTAINASTLGKVIRSVFKGIGTRRLGRRGKAKYHYYGIRIKPTFPLNSEYCEEIDVKQGQSSRKQSESSTDSDDTSSDLNRSGQDYGSPNQQIAEVDYLEPTGPVLPPFSKIDIVLPDGVSETNLSDFLDAYRKHSQTVMDAVVTCQFSTVETVWKNFWGKFSSKNGESGSSEQLRRVGKTAPNVQSLLVHLPKREVLLLCDTPALVDYLQQCDRVLYQTITDTLIPDGLQPIPVSLNQSLRKFAKELEPCMKSTLEQMPHKLITAKVSAVRYFGHSLLRHLSLNQMSQAAHALLQDPQTTLHMLTDWKLIDFNHVQRQAVRVCPPNSDTEILQMKRSMSFILQQKHFLQHWPKLLASILDRVLKQYKGKSNYSEEAQQFLLRWSYYWSMIMEDLTLRRAQSFGSFRLIQLLFDEYMGHQVEHHITIATGQVPLAVVSDKKHAGLKGTWDKGHVLAKSHPEVNDKQANAADLLINSFLSTHTKEQGTPTKRTKISDGPGVDITK